MAPRGGLSFQSNFRSSPTPKATQPKNTIEKSPITNHKSTLIFLNVYQIKIQLTQEVVSISYEITLP